MKIIRKKKVFDRSVIDALFPKSNIFLYLPHGWNGDKHSGLYAVSDEDRDRLGVISVKSHDGEYCEEKRVDNGWLFQRAITPLIEMRIV